MARQHNPKAMKPSPLIMTHDWVGYDDLAVALFRYHAARSYGPEQAYWLARLGDIRPAPKPTLNL
jgi:hypothetical protein